MLLKTIHDAVVIDELGLDHIVALLHVLVVLFLRLDGLDGSEHLLGELQQRFDSLVGEGQSAMTGGELS